jgi:hypothetical protein
MKRGAEVATFDARSHVTSDQMRASTASLRAGVVPALRARVVPARTCASRDAAR